MKLEIVTPPALEPITASVAKRHLRLETDDSLYQYETDYIANLITMSREQAEFHTRRAFITQTWKLYLNEWPSGNSISLPLPPLISVTHVKYTDTDSVQSTFTDYSVDTGTPGRVVLDDGESWPSDSLHPKNPIEIQFVAGYGPAVANVPASIRQAMLLQIGHLYENRERVIAGVSVTNVPFAFDSLLASYRWFPE